MKKYRIEIQPFGNDSPCTGTVHCSLCIKCSRFTLLKRDDSFLVQAPGNANHCPAFKELSK